MDFAVNDRVGLSMGGVQHKGTVMVVDHGGVRVRWDDGLVEFIHGFDKPALVKLKTD